MNDNMLSTFKSIFHLLDMVTDILMIKEIYDRSDGYKHKNLNFIILIILLSVCFINERIYAFHILKEYYQESIIKTKDLSIKNIEPSLITPDKKIISIT